MVKLTKSNEAVSPVIGVILMVAITVVLAAVVFVMVSNISVDADTPTALSFRYTDSDNTFTLLNEPSEPLSYGNLVIRSDGVSRSFTVNGVAPVATQSLTAGDELVITGLTNGEHDLSFIVNGSVVYSKTITI